MLHALRLLRSAPRAGRAEIEAFQSARLRKLVAHAWANVPFYRRFFDAHGLEPRHVRGVRDLHRIPIVSRRDLQEADAKDLVAQGRDPSQLITSSTSGSTGEPVQIRRTWLEQNVQHLYRLRALKEIGVRRNDRVLMVSVVRPVHPRDFKLLGRLLSAVGLQRSRLQVHVQLDAESIAREYVRARADVLSGSPSIFLRLGQVMPEADRQKARPRLIVSGGEVLLDEQRTRIEQELGAPVRNVYASFEIGLLAWECVTSGAMHTSDDSVIVEILSNGRPAEPGESGEVIATNLHSFASPFIRYRQGDVATRGVTPCSCGKSFATIAGIQGRELDFLPLADGRVLHPYDISRAFLAHAYGSFRQMQLTQERIDRIVVRLVPAGDPQPERLVAVRSAVREILGPGVDLEVLFVPHIPNEPGGKFRVARSFVREG